MAREFGFLMAVAVLVVGAPAMAQLQAPRPELTTVAPSQPATGAPRVLAPSRPTGPSAPPLSSQAAALSAVQPSAPQPAVPPRRRNGSDIANNLNHVEMERLRQTRPDIAPPAAPSPQPIVTPAHYPATDSSIADELNRDELGSRAGRMADDP
jgi:hypothetical protein